MSQETVLKDSVMDETRDRINKVERDLDLFRDAPYLAPEHPCYTFENGTPYAPPTKSEAPLIPDCGFDGPA
jgi:hypothetical protein